MSPIPGENPANDRNVTEVMNNVFDECQRSFNPHHRSVITLVELQNQAPEEFETQFITCINRILQVYKREPAVERLVSFVQLACNALVEDDTVAASSLGDEFSIKLINHLLQYSTAADKSVRLRVCQLIGHLLKGIASEDAIDDQLWDDLLDNMLERANDKLPSIRVFAVQALERLQDPSNQEDPVIQTFLRLVQQDTSKEVRKAVLKSMGISKHTIHALLTRTNDIKEDVRVCAYKQLGERVHMQGITIQHRVDVLERGLRSRSQPVQQACEHMLASHWFGMKNGDALALVKSLDPEMFEDTAVLAVKSLVHASASDPVLKEHLGDIEIRVTELVKPENGTVTPELALYMRVICDMAAKSKDMDYLDSVVPDVVSFCDLVEVYKDMLVGVFARRKQHEEAHQEDEDDEDDGELLAIDEELAKVEFILRQFISISTCLDMRYDEVGRKRMVDLLTSISSMEYVSSDLMRCMMDVLRHSVAQESEFVRLALDMISELRDPMGSSENAESDEREVAKVALVEMMEQLSALVEKQAVLAESDPEAAVELDDEIAEIQGAVKELQHQSGDGHLVDEPWRLLRCLEISSAILRQSKSQVVNGEVSGLLDNFILPCIQSGNSPIRQEAVHALGLYCGKVETAAREFLPVLKAFVLAMDEHVDIRAIALKAVFDLLMVNGVMVGSEGDGNGEEDNKNAFHEAVGEWVDFLLPFLEDEDLDLKTTAVEGFAKLMFTGRIHDPRILQCLLVMYLHPASEDSTRLKQCLSVFFPEYSHARLENKRTIEVVAMPTIQAVSQVGASPELADVPVDHLVQYLIFLLSSGPTDAKSSTVPPSRHSSLGMGLLREIFADPTGKHTRTFAKSLLLLQTEQMPLEKIQGLQFMVNEVLHEEGFTDKTATRSVEKFQQALGERQSAHPEGEPAALSRDQEASIAADNEARVQEVHELHERSNAKGRRGTRRSTRTTARRQPTRRARNDEGADDGVEEQGSQVEEQESQVEEQESQEPAQIDDTDNAAVVKQEPTICVKVEPGMETAAATPTAHVDEVPHELEVNGDDLPADAAPTLVPSTLDTTELDELLEASSDED